MHNSFRESANVYKLHQESMLMMINQHVRNLDTQLDSFFLSLSSSYWDKVKQARSVYLSIFQGVCKKRTTVPGEKAKKSVVFLDCSIFFGSENMNLCIPTHMQCSHVPLPFLNKVNTEIPRKKNRWRQRNFRSFFFSLSLAWFFSLLVQVYLTVLSTCDFLSEEKNHNIFPDPENFSSVSSLKQK